MSWAFSCTVTGGGRGLLVRHGEDQVVEVAFGLPGEPVPGWEADATEARLTRADDFTARLRHLPDDAGWTTVVSLDNHADAERALPPLGMGVTVAPRWAGWSWTSDTEGIIVAAPRDAAGPVLLLRVTQGFLRAASARPAFVAGERRSDGLGDGVAAFHLAHPTGALRAFGRHQTTLEFSALPRIEDAAGLVPGWLPDPIVPPGEVWRLDLPDMAIVPGPGITLSTDDTTSVLDGAPGHREVAIHGVRGVQRLGVDFVPALEPFLADLVTALKSRRPSAVSSATGALVAVALARRAVLDPENVLDWLEREDWLARGDLFGLAAATVVAAENLDEALLADTCAAVSERAWEPGLGLVATRCWLATLRLGVPPLDLSAVLARASTAGSAGGAAGALEAAVLGGGPEPSSMPGPVHVFAAGVLPGAPVGLSEADAGLRAAILRLVPEGWASRTSASAAAERAAALLLTDHVDGLHPSHDGLAWLLLGDLGA